LPRYAEIKDTQIINVIVADEAFINEHKPEAIECPDWVGAGDKYENGEFSRVTIVAIEETVEEN
jgi:hypothetical protein